jgi:colanic acid/amylovoran biosynthesis protein
MVEGIKHCIDKFDAKIHIFPHVTIDNDVEVSFVIYKKMPDNYKQKITVYNQDYSAVELKSIYSNMNIFIGTRLHSTIFAIGEGVPSICISYHGTKSEGIFENYGLSKYAMNEYSDKLLINAIDSLVNDNLKVREILNEKNNCYREELLTVFNKIFI